MRGENAIVIRNIPTLASDVRHSAIRGKMSNNQTTVFIKNSMTSAEVDLDEVVTLRLVKFNNHP